MAPTGVAADNIAGYNIHSQLPIPVHGPDSAALKPTGESLKNLQARFQDTTYIIFDEMSMIGRRTLGMVYQLLRVAKSNSDSMIVWWSKRSAFWRPWAATTC
eukprot:2486182-Pleurochrysis_carterae.AAC.1